jgi:hypothetical protein
MNDITIKEALLALAKFNQVTLESHLSLGRLVAQKLPGVSETERQEWLTALENDRQRLEALKAVVAKL